MRLFMFGIIFLLVGCAGREVRYQPQVEAISASRLSFTLTANRYLELEPCGCIANPKGGVAREWNLIQKWKKEKWGEMIPLVSGNTFVPLAPDFNASKRAHFLLKAEFVVRALNGFQTLALSPTIDDTALGIESLKKLEAQATFPFVSSNLVDKENRPVFKSYAELKGGSILILGISHSSDGSYPPDKKVVVRDPIESVREILESLPKRERFVVVLSSLEMSELRRFTKVMGDRVHLVLGGIESDARASAKILSRKVLYANPLYRGQAIAKVDVEIGKILSRPHWTQGGGAKDGGSFHRTQVVKTDDSYEDASNPMAKLVSDFKRRVREIAVSDAVNSH